ncbi:MAG: VRR-NUC domain-containing protein [Huintestinicola sp.]
MSFTRETQIEAYLRDKAKQHGGYALKWVCPSWDGVPDRILILPYGRIAFVELKSPGKTARPNQLRWQERLRNLGFKAYIADSKKDIDEIFMVVMSDEI